MIVLLKVTLNSLDYVAVFEIFEVYSGKHKKIHAERLKELSLYQILMFFGCFLPFSCQHKHSYFVTGASALQMDHPQDSSSHGTKPGPIILQCTLKKRRSIPSAVVHCHRRKRVANGPKRRLERRIVLI